MERAPARSIPALWEEEREFILKRIFDD